MGLHGALRQLRIQEVSSIAFCLTPGSNRLGGDHPESPYRPVMKRRHKSRAISHHRADSATRRGRQNSANFLSCTRRMNSFCVLASVAESRIPFEATTNLQNGLYSSLCSESGGT